MDIIELAKDINEKPLIDALYRVPNKEYKNASELEEPLTKKYHGMFPNDPVKKIKVNTDYLDFVQNIKNEQPQHESDYEFRDEKWDLKSTDRRLSVYVEFIGKIAREHKIHGSHAIKLIMKRKDLLKRLTDYMGTDDERRVYYMLKEDADYDDRMEQFHERRRRAAEKYMEAVRIWSKKGANASKEEMVYMLEEIPARIRVNLPRIKFPANRNEIIMCATTSNPVKIISILRHLPDKSYMLEDIGRTLEDVTGLNKIPVKVTLKKLVRPLRLIVL